MWIMIETPASNELRREPGGGSGAETIAERLRSRIAEGELRPGLRLSEERLSDQLGVSRNTLREAFRLLSHERLVEHRFNRGVFVCTLDKGDVVDVFAARRLIQLAAVRSCAPDDPGLDDAAAACDEARRAVDREDWRTVGSANIHFHRALVATLHSERIDALMGALLAELRLAFLVVEEQGQFHGAYIERNAEIVTLLRQGNTGAAERALAHYLNDAEEQLLAATSVTRRSI
jgi:DNA-binding GntR family transcriptional regulator